MGKKYTTSAIGHKSFNIFILPIILFAITYLTFGFYFETNDDYVISMLLGGNLLPNHGAVEVYYLHKLMLLAYSFLYDIYNISWYGIFLCFFNLIAVINIFYVMHKIFGEYLSNVKVTLILILFYFIVIIESIVLISFYKTAILLSGSSLLIIFIYYTYPQKNKKDLINIFLFLFLFSLGFFSRPPASVLTLFIIIPFAVFTYYKLEQIKQVLYTISAFLMFVILLQVSYTALKTNEQHEREDFTSAWLNATEYGFEKPIDLSNQRDSIRREALRKFYVTDRNVITNEFMEKVSSPYVFTSDKLVYRRLKGAVADIISMAFYDYTAITILNIVLAILLSYKFLKKTKSKFFIFLVIQLFFFLFLTSINVFMKLPSRLFFPLYEIYTLCNLWLLQGEIKIYRKNLLNYCLILVVVISLISFYSFYNKAAAYKIQYSENVQINKYIGGNFSNATILITQPSYSILDRLDPLKTNEFKSNKIFCIAGWPTIMPSYYQELKSSYNSSNLNDLFNYIRSNPGEFIIISDDKFIEFMHSYFKILYNNEVDFALLPGAPEVMKKRNLNLYIISK